MLIPKYDLCFDIDGVITIETTGIDHSIKTPNTSMIIAINTLYKRGKKICFYTARPKCDEKATREWFKQHGLPEDAVIYFDKPLAEVYLDDKAHKYRG